MLENLRSLVNWRLVVYGLLYILIMRFRPEGIMGYKEFSLKKTIKFFKELPQNWPGYMEKFKEKLTGRRKRS